MSKPKHSRCPACNKTLDGRPYNDPRPGQPLWYECRTENCPLFGMEGFAWHWGYIALQARLINDLESEHAAYLDHAAHGYDNPDRLRAYEAAGKTTERTRAKLAKLDGREEV